MSHQEDDPLSDLRAELERVTQGVALETEGELAEFRRLLEKHSAGPLLTTLVLENDLEAERLRYRPWEETASRRALMPLLLSAALAVPFGGPSLSLGLRRAICESCNKPRSAEARYCPRCGHRRQP